MSSMQEEKRSFSGLLFTDELQALRRSARRSLAILAMHFKLVPRWKDGRIVWSGRHACHVRLTGKVQGVFLRAWTRDEAKQFGVGGWIRNCPDGSVEAHLEGSRMRSRNSLTACARCHPMRV